MLFSSLVFIFIFLPGVLLVNYLLPAIYRNYFLFFASIIFYAWGEPKFVFVMLISIAINYTAAMIVERVKWKKIALVLCLIINLLILFMFKYLNFTISNIDRIFADLIPQTSITLPIGISFFTFQAISYVVDVYRQDVKAQRNPFFVGLYIALFPQLIAGPIVRYTTIEKQINHRTVTLDKFGEGVFRFIAGLAKKVIIANNVAIVANGAFDSVGNGNLSVSMAWLGAIAYTLQIYFDFSGYSDMAIGLGKMLGFEYLENFNFPYISKSASEFWRRWHISLGTWFRDYVYIPLGGSKVKPSRHIMNMFIVWALTGLWHGANWTFIVWGLLYFVLLTFEKYSKFAQNPEEHNILRHIYALFFIVIGWVIFRSCNIHMAIDYISSMLFVGADSFICMDTVKFISEYWIIFLVAILYSSNITETIKNKISINSGAVNLIISIIKILVYSILLIWSVSFLVIGAHNPFIYFNF